MEKIWKITFSNPFFGHFEAGDMFDVSAMFYTHNADDLNQGGSHGVLFAKYFNSNWGMIGIDSVHFRGAAVDAWHELSLACTYQMKHLLLYRLV
ncbi:MAG: hypothetical protein Ct9H300mP18_08270 [Candidatus Neomarinimicrobiota bacterium]|nr:MAG: hypothetical protein Ct9H300mP18_08270 [Candidatus Neomarinimicrobiota bacterium]